MMVNGYFIALTVHLATCLLLAGVHWITQRKIRGFEWFAMAYVVLASSIFIFLITDDLEGLLLGLSLVCLVTLLILVTNHQFTPSTLILFLCLIPLGIYLINILMEHVLISYSNIMGFLVTPLTIVLVKKDDLRLFDKAIGTVGLLLVFFSFMFLDFDNLFNTCKTVVVAENYLETHYDEGYKSLNNPGGFRGSAIELRFYHDVHDSVRLVYENGVVQEVHK